MKDPVPCVSTAFRAKTAPLPCVSIAFRAKAAPLPAGFQARTILLSADSEEEKLEWMRQLHAATRSAAEIV